MNETIAAEIRDELSICHAPTGGPDPSVVDRLLARIARRPGLWRRRMRTRHRREEERLSPLPHAA
jgi:hypothetical protein